MRKIGRLPSDGGMTSVALGVGNQMSRRFAERALDANRHEGSAMAVRTKPGCPGVVHHCRTERHEVRMTGVALQRSRNVVG